MRKKRKKASAVIVDGIVHAIGKPEPVVIEPDNWDALSRPRGYPLRHTTRAARQADKARAVREWIEPRVSLLCDAQPRMIWVTNGSPFRMPPWRSAPRTHARINCMACLVALGRT